VQTKDFCQKTSNIWFKDQEEPVYDPTDPISDYQFTEYWRREKDRILNGFTIAGGQVKVSGWLYWHTVYWKIRMKKKVGNRTFPVIETPLFRDIDWEASINFERALDDGKFIELVGSRSFGKTVWQSSMSARIYTVIDKSQVVVSAGNGADIKTVTDMISQGLTNIHPVLQKKRLKNDWKGEVQAGFKTADGETSPKSSLSQIIIRNYQDGNESMAANGTRPDFHIIDEIGKIYKFINCVKDSDGCWWANDSADADGRVRPSCLPFFTGTGGDMEQGKDAATMFFDPVTFNLLEFEDKWEGKGKIGWFISALRARMEYKYPQTLAKYLGIDHPDLEKITILVSDEEKAFKDWWEPTFLKNKKSGNATVLLRFKAYWPTKPSDSFIVLSSNNFDTEAAKFQQARIKVSGGRAAMIELAHDGTKIVHKASDKEPIIDFPARDHKDAPIQIWEFPDESPPFGLYVAGVDPYKQGQAKYSDSLGAIYIMKRMHDIQSERYQDMFVASYVARPDRKEDWETQARLLIKWYNARTLVENDEYSFIEYMKSKGDSMYLERQPAWLKEIVPNTQVNREFGIHRSSERIRIHLHDSLKKYMEQVVHQETDDRGSITLEYLGVTKMLDTMLLEEIIKWNDEDNFDRVIAAELAIALARHLDPIIGKASDKEDPRFKSYFTKRPKVSTLFDQGAQRSYMKKVGSKLFI
jgi:hypothetical protein